MDDTILKISNLSKTYGSKTILDNVSFEIKRGKIYGFIGENGAGKTTAIRAITGLSPIEHGSNSSESLMKPVVQRLEESSDALLKNRSLNLINLPGQTLCPCSFSTVTMTAAG